jgi:transcriptional regulator with XRE-family HTH domain
VAKAPIHPVDRIVGNQLRLARTSRGLSQTQLAKASKISFQQVEKYERATNRVSASRLFEFATVLGVDVAYFYRGTGKLKIEPVDAGPFFDISRIDADIVRVVSQISGARLKRSLLELVSAFPSVSAKAKRRKRHAK